MIPFYTKLEKVPTGQNSKVSPLQSHLIDETKQLRGKSAHFRDPMIPKQRQRTTAVYPVPHLPHSPPSFAPTPRTQPLSQSCSTHMARWWEKLYHRPHRIYRKRYAPYSSVGGANAVAILYHLPAAYSAYQETIRLHCQFPPPLPRSTHILRW